MKNNSKESLAYRITMILVFLQLIYKLWVELVKARDVIANYWFAGPLFWSGTLGWVLLIPLLVSKNRIALLVTGFAGIANGVVGILFPLLNVCDHYIVGYIIFVHGIAIAFFSFKANRELGVQ